MAKKSKIAKAKKQQETIERYAALRQELKAQKDYEGLRKLPLDARPERLKNRDLIDGRPRGYMRKFGMSRIKFRELAHKGLIPGVKKPAGSPSLAVKEEGAWTTPWIIKKDTFASSSRNAGTRSGRIFFYAQLVLFLYVKAAWLLRYTYLVTGVSASMPTLIFNARSTSAIIGRSK